MLFRRKPDKHSIRVKFVKLLYDLKQLHGRIMLYISRIENRVKLLESRVNHEGGATYKAEYMRIREMYLSLLRKLKVVNVVLDYLETRLETLSLVNEFNTQARIIKSVLQEIRSYTKGIPDIELIIEDLIERAAELIAFSEESSKGDELSMPLDREIKRILESARVAAKEGGRS